MKSWCYLLFLLYLESFSTFTTKNSPDLEQTITHKILISLRVIPMYLQDGKFRMYISIRQPLEGCVSNTRSAGSVEFTAAASMVHVPVIKDQALVG